MEVHPKPPGWQRSSRPAFLSQCALSGFFGAWHSRFTWNPSRTLRTCGARSKTRWVQGGYLVFHLVDGLAAMLAQVAPTAFYSPKPGRKRDRRSDGCISGHISSRSDSYSCIYLCFVRITFIPAALLIGFWFLAQLVNGVSGTSADRRSGLFGAHQRIHLRGCHGAFVRRPASTGLAGEHRMISRTDGFEVRRYELTFGEIDRGIRSQ